MIFMKFGNLEGPSLVEDYRGWIDVRSVEFGLETENSDFSGGKLGFSRPDFDELIFTKTIDAVSPELFGVSCMAEPNLVTFDFVQSGGIKVLPYLTVRLEGAIISDYLLSAPIEEEIPEETLSLQFASIKMIYRTYDENGDEVRTIESGWSLVENRRI